MSNIILYYNAYVCIFFNVEGIIFLLLVSLLISSLMKFLADFEPLRNSFM